MAFASWPAVVRPGKPQCNSSSDRVRAARSEGQDVSASVARSAVDIALEVPASGNRAGKESEIDRPGSSASDKVGKQVQTPSSEGSSGSRSCPAASLARSA